MSGKRAEQSRAAAKLTQGPAKPHRAKKVLLFIVPLIVTVAVTAGYFTFFRPQSDKAAAAAATPIKMAPAAPTLDDLLKMTPEQLADVDIAETNLLCATGLRGAENLNVGKALACLNDWAKTVRDLTDLNMPDFRQNPGRFENSEAKFRVLMLISVVQKEFGVHYNNRGERNCDFSNSKNAFLHGMIDDANGGTCASMPVMYVAIGRRLGYPMKLVLAKTHIFARWEEPASGERFNIEGTRQRFSDHPDSYYRNWPEPISDDELKQGYYLKSLTPAEELAVFLVNRAYCLMDTGRYEEARGAYAESYRLAPQNPLGREQIAMAAAEVARARRAQQTPTSSPADAHQPRAVSLYESPNPAAPLVRPYGSAQPSILPAPNPYGPTNPSGPQSVHQLPIPQGKGALP